MHVVQPGAGWVSPLRASPRHFLGRGSSFDVESTIRHQVHLQREYCAFSSLAKQHSSEERGTADSIHKTGEGCRKEGTLWQNWQKGKLVAHVLFQSTKDLPSPANKGNFSAWVNGGGFLLNELNGTASFLFAVEQNLT